MCFWHNSIKLWGLIVVKRRLLGNGGEPSQVVCHVIFINCSRSFPLGLIKIIIWVLSPHGLIQRQGRILIFVVRTDEVIRDRRFSQPRHKVHGRLNVPRIGEINFNDVLLDLFFFVHLKLLFSDYPESRNQSLEFDLFAKTVSDPRTVFCSAGGPQAGAVYCQQDR